MKPIINMFSFGSVCLFSEELTLKPVTNWVVADLSMKEGRALVKAALKQMVFMSVFNNIGMVYCR